MRVHPFVTTGVSFAAAVAVTATVALAPPMSPHDVKVASATRVALAADEGLFKALVDGYFYDGDGTEGIFQAFLNRFAGAGSPTSALVNDYFDVAPEYALGQYLQAQGDPTSELSAYLRAYFGQPLAPGQDPATLAAYGPSEAERLFLLTHFTDPEQQRLINLYFDGNLNGPNGGPGAVIQDRLLASTADPVQRQFINDYFNGGPGQVLRTSLLAATADPQQRQLVIDYFGDPNPADPDNPPPFGPAQVIRNQLLARTGDVEQRRLINVYFDGVYNSPNGGPGALIEDLLANATQDPNQKTIIHAYFAGGLKEVLRLLFDPVDSTPAPVVTTPDEEEDDVTTVSLARTVAPKTLAFAKIDPATTDAAPVDDPAPADAGKAAVASVAAVSAPAAAPASNPTPASDPVPVAAAPSAPAAAPVSAPVAPAADPDPAPAASSSTVKDTDPDASSTPAIKSGNKVSPTIILPGGGGSKDGGVNVFGQIADAIAKGIQGAFAPPKKPASAGGSESAGSSGGDSGSSSSGGAGGSSGGSGGGAS
jgi:hypothetical protein